LHRVLRYEKDQARISPRDKQRPGGVTVSEMEAVACGDRPRDLTYDDSRDRQEGAPSWTLAIWCRFRLAGLLVTNSLEIIGMRVHRNLEAELDINSVHKGHGLTNQSVPLLGCVPQ
jgi:hypothetical protein